MAQTQRNRKTAQENMDDVKSISETKVEPLVAEEPKELNMEQKVTVRSIANWTTGFQRIETNGDVTIPANGTARLSRSEIISQVQNGNRLFLGTDDRGSHATLYIEDKQTREEVDFDNESEGIIQSVLTDESVKKLFAIKNKREFDNTLHSLVVTRAEKYTIIELIKKNKFNDFEKIRTVESYTGISC